jgi:hypothetical protein
MVCGGDGGSAVCEVGVDYGQQYWGWGASAGGMSLRSVCGWLDSSD